MRSFKPRPEKRPKCESHRTLFCAVRIQSSPYGSDTLTIVTERRQSNTKPHIENCRLQAFPTRAWQFSLEVRRFFSNGFSFSHSHFHTRANVGCDAFCKHPAFLPFSSGGACHYCRVEQVSPVTARVVRPCHVTFCNGN